MKTSKLIKKLVSSLKKNGDLDILFVSSDIEDEVNRLIQGDTDDEYVFEIDTGSGVPISDIHFGKVTSYTDYGPDDGEEREEVEIKYLPLRLSYFTPLEEK